MASTDLLISTQDGLFCPDGGFHIDPWRPVDRAIITHAHSDHATPGCRSYLCSTRGVGVLQERMGQSAAVTGVSFGERLELGSVRVSLHPAGHILGSAQIRVERSPTEPARRGETWVFSGDYKTEPDRTCDPFDPVSCDVFITESTFGLPIYHWTPEAFEFGRINAWWLANAAESRTSMLFAYSLGKAQRLLAGVDASIGPIAVHGTVERMNQAYRAAGVGLPDAPHAAGDFVPVVRGKGLVIAPPSALGTSWVRKFASAEGGISAGFASGWMQVRGTRRRRAVDRGFVISDHADWNGLLSAIRATGASRVGVTHGYVQPLVRWLTESGMSAFAVPTKYTGERGEDQAEPETSRGTRVSEEADGATQP